MASTKLFFVTDIHGSDRCFKKFLNSAKFYKASVLVLGGDITGKMIIPIVKQSDGTYKCASTFRNAVLKSQKELDETSSLIRDSGFYPYICGTKEYAELESNPELVKKL